MKRAILFSLLTGVLATSAAAQQINLDIPQNIRDKASEEVTVTLDARMLRLASKFLADNRDQREIRDMVQKLQGIYVRSYSFDREGEYDRAIVGRIRSQLGPGWQKIVDVRSRDRENSEIYTQTTGEDITGLVVITAEPKELTIVNIVGPVDLDRLAALDGQFGIRLGKDKKESKR